MTTTNNQKESSPRRTETILIDGEPVMVKRSELGPPSEPAHEGTLGGERSHAYRGHAMAAEWSKDVGMEGEPDPHPS